MALLRLVSEVPSANRDASERLGFIDRKLSSSARGHLAGHLHTSLLYPFVLSDFQ